MPYVDSGHGASIEYWHRPYSSLGEALALVVRLSPDKHLHLYLVAEGCYDVVGSSFVAHITDEGMEIAAWALSPSLLLQEGFVLED